MKKKISFLLPLLLCLGIACNGAKKSKSDDIQIPTDSIAQLVVHNFLVGNSYHVTSQDNDRGSCETVWMPPSRMKGGYSYGVYIIFVDSTHYQQGNSAPCGNDCFFSQMGRYRLLPDNKLALTLDSISYHGMCMDTPTVHGDGKEILMNVAVSADSIVYLTPIKEVAKPD